MCRGFVTLCKGVAVKLLSFLCVWRHSQCNTNSCNGNEDRSRLWVQRWTTDTARDASNLILYIITSSTSTSTIRSNSGSGIDCDCKSGRQAGWTEGGKQGEGHTSREAHCEGVEEKKSMLIIHKRDNIHKRREREIQFEVERGKEEEEDVENTVVEDKIFFPRVSGRIRGRKQTGCLARAHDALNPKHDS